MSDRAIFANTITDMDKGMPRGISDCERFGMTWGCKIDCPAFWDGECKCAGENVDEFIKDCNEDMIAEMKRLYPSLEIVETNLLTKQTSLPETKEVKE